MKECPNKQRVNRKQVFLQFMRFVAVTVVTVWLLVLLIASTDKDDFLATFIIVASIVASFFTIPIIGFWIYSFVKAVGRRTKTDRTLLWFHIADLFLLGLIICLGNSPVRNCSAKIMAEHYEKYGNEMRNVAKQARDMIPDCGGEIAYEFGDSNYVSHEPVPSDNQLFELKEQLESVGCIGIATDNRGERDCTTIRFRRIGMGMYSFRLYDHPLTLQQQDSLNANECLIVYNDSTVFEFMSGVFGTQVFVGKDELLKNKHKKE